MVLKKYIYIVSQTIDIYINTQIPMVCDTEFLLKVNTATRTMSHLLLKCLVTYAGQELRNIKHKNLQNLPSPQRGYCCDTSTNHVSIIG
jgi:hypothetical protein